MNLNVVFFLVLLRIHFSHSVINVKQVGIIVRSILFAVDCRKTACILDEHFKPSLSAREQLEVQFMVIITQCHNIVRIRTLSQCSGVGAIAGKIENLRGMRSLHSPTAAPLCPFPVLAVSRFYFHFRVYVSPKEFMHLFRSFHYLTSF